MSIIANNFLQKNSHKQVKNLFGMEDFVDQQQQFRLWKVISTEDVISDFTEQEAQSQCDTFRQGGRPSVEQTTNNVYT